MERKQIFGMDFRYPFTKEQVIRSLNARSRFMGRVSDDPLPGVTISHDMLIWAQSPDKSPPNPAARRPKP